MHYYYPEHFRIGIIKFPCLFNYRLLIDLISFASSSNIHVRVYRRFVCGYETVAFLLLLLGHHVADHFVFCAIPFAFSVLLTLSSYCGSFRLCAIPFAFSPCITLSSRCGSYHLAFSHGLTRYKIPVHVH